MSSKKKEDDEKLLFCVTKFASLMSSRPKAKQKKIEDDNNNGNIEIRCRCRLMIRRFAGLSSTLQLFLSIGIVTSRMMTANM